MIGKTLGSYRIVHELGSGGMGKVYAAEHTTIGRRAAIKVLLSRYSRDKPVTERFFREATAATRIHHPGIIDIFDFGWAEDGSAYIMMELLEGESLHDRIKRFGRLHDEETLRLSRQMANALAAAHAAGIVHRDLKPDNVFLVPDAEVMGGERVKLLDFGIAKVTDELGNSVSKTSTGMILGSPLYMSPEQCMGNKEVDHRADIYALGCVMYHMICGRPPFTGSGSGKIIAQHIYEKPKPPSFYQPTVRPEVEAIMVRALGKEPEERFASMVEFEQALVNAGAASFTGGRHIATPVHGHALPPTVEIMTNRVSGNISAQMPGAGNQPLSAADSALQPASEHYGSPTTLGSVASQITGASASKSRRGRLWLAMAAITLAIAGGLVAWQFGSGDGGKLAASSRDASSLAPAVDSTSPKSDGDTKPVTNPEPAADAGSNQAENPALNDATPGNPEPAVPVDTDQPQPAAEMVKFRITTIKPDHAVVRDSESNLLGETPLTIEVPKDGQKKLFVVSRDGYRDETFTLVADQSRKKRLKLRKARPGSSSPGSSNTSSGQGSTEKPDPPPDPDGDGVADDDDDNDDKFGETVDPFAN